MRRDLHCSQLLTNGLSCLPAWQSNIQHKRVQGLCWKSCRQITILETATFIKYDCMTFLSFQGWKLFCGSHRCGTTYFPRIVHRRRLLKLELVCGYCGLHEESFRNIKRYSSCKIWKSLGPVVQSPIKLMLKYWKF